MNRSHPRMQDLLDTVDVLRLVAQRGQQELHGFSWYMVVWGLYAALNLSLELLIHRSYWYPLLFVAFFFSTLPVAGLLTSLGIWLAVLAITSGAYALSHNAVLALVVLVLGATGGYLVAYRIAIRRGRYRPLPLKVALAPRLGWAWGMVMAGMALVFWNLTRLVPEHQIGTLSLLLWGYALGVGLFLSGILHPGFFWLGIAALFGIPLATALSPVVGSWAYVAIALAMAAFGAYLRSQTRHESSGRSVPQPDRA